MCQALALIYIYTPIYSLSSFMSYTHEILTMTPVRKVLGVFPVYLSQPQFLRSWERPVRAGPPRGVPIHPSIPPFTYASVYQEYPEDRHVRLLLRPKVLEYDESWSVPPDVSHLEELQPQRGLWVGHPNSKVWHLPWENLSSTAVDSWEHSSRIRGMSYFSTLFRTSFASNAYCSRSVGKALGSEISLSPF